VVSHDTVLFGHNCSPATESFEPYLLQRTRREGRREIKIQSLKAHPPNFQWYEGMKRNERSIVPKSYYHPSPTLTQF
jgi:hypothetical protein